MTDTSAAPRGRRRSQQSHQAILRAAIDLVREGGYSNLSIEAIAARAGVGKQTIYRWWPSKGAVVVDAFSSEIMQFTDWSYSGDFRADLIAQIRHVAAMLGDPALGPHLAALHCEALHDPAVADAIYQGVVSASRRSHREWLSGAQAHGHVRDDIDIDLAIDMMYGPLWFRLFTRAVPLDDLDPSALAEAVLRAIAPQPGIDTDR